MKQGVKIEVLPELQESSDLPCDTGSEKAELEADGTFAAYGLDFSRCVVGWNSNTGKWAPTPEALKERARVARNLLKGREETHVVAVLHGGVSWIFDSERGVADCGCSSCIILPRTGREMVNSRVQGGAIRNLGPIRLWRRRVIMRRSWKRRSRERGGSSIHWGGRSRWSLRGLRVEIGEFLFFLLAFWGLRGS